MSRFSDFNTNELRQLIRSLRQFAFPGENMQSVANTQPLLEEAVKEFVARNPNGGVLRRTAGPTSDPHGLSTR